MSEELEKRERVEEQVGKEERLERELEGQVQVEKQRSFLKGLVIGSGVLLAVLTVFWFGMFVGEQKAAFSYRWGEQYHRIFGGPPVGPPLRGGPRMFAPPRHGFFGGHGAAGEIVKVSSGEIVLRSPENVERVAVLTGRTVVLRQRKEVGQEELKLGQQVVVIGRPNRTGRIEARLIRIFDLRRDMVWPGRDHAFSSL